jgi:hypothetical protein
MKRADEQEDGGTPSSISKNSEEEQGGAGSSNSSSSSNNKNNPLDFLFNPYESKIPKEVEAEIYRAEANTIMAQNRNQRVALYAAVAVVGVLLAFFNAFLSELRGGGGVSSPAEAGMDPFDLSTSAFAWVQGNPIFDFLFLNKIGGGLMLLIGCGSGLMAEAELDSRRINAERIWEELQKRRDANERRALKKQERQQQKKQQHQGRKGERALGNKKKAKRLTALSEVVGAEPMKSTDAATDAVETPPVIFSSQQRSAMLSDQNVAVGEGAGTDVVPERSAEGSGGGGLFQGVKDLYAKADSMAASQALLLNKKLEDAGLIEKITDETGLKVIGREQAAAAARASDEGSPEESKEKSSTHGRER